jgi:RNA exonuclease 4
MNFEMIQKLKDLGADGSTVNKYGETAEECLATNRTCYTCKKKFKAFAHLVAHQHSANHGSGLLAIDCEFVGVIVPPRTVKQCDGLARVAISDIWGNAIYHSWCLPDGLVADYRTWCSGVRETDLLGAPSFATVQKQVLDVIKGRTLLGHSIHHDLNALKFAHLNLPVLDTYVLSKELGHEAGCLSLSALCELYLDRSIQSGEHNPLEDARATMDLYLVLKREKVSTKRFHAMRK